MGDTTPALDEAFERMAAASFELPNGFVNHGAMACEALAVLDCTDDIGSWARRFARAGGASVDPVVSAGFEWRQALGDYYRLAHIPATDGAAALAQVLAEHAALYAATEPVTHPYPASPPGSELAVAAVRSLDPHQVKLVEACWRGHAATDDPAFAAAAETVTGLHA
jgi:hypothetical protein